MQGPPGYERYPLWIVIASNLLSVLIWLIGAVILYQAGPVWAVLYLAFVLVLEYRLISGHCVDCYYYGKTCAFGKGRLSCIFFSKGEPERFSRMQLTWKDIVPDFLAFFLPVLAGVALLVLEFRLTVLILVIVLLCLGFFGNAFVRGRLACRYCRQREIGCPAERLFKKNQANR